MSRELKSRIEEMTRDLLAEKDAEIERLRAILKELLDHTLECERQLDTLHGLGADAGSGCSDVACRAMEIVNEQNAPCAGCGEEGGKPLEDDWFEKLAKRCSE